MLFVALVCKDSLWEKFCRRISRWYLYFAFTYIPVFSFDMCARWKNKFYSFIIISLALLADKLLYARLLFFLIHL